MTIVCLILHGFIEEMRQFKKVLYMKLIYIIQQLKDEAEYVEYLTYFRRVQASLKMRDPTYQDIENEYYESANNYEDEDELS